MIKIKFSENKTARTITEDTPTIRQIVRLLELTALSSLKSLSKKEQLEYLSITEKLYYDCPIRCSVPGNGVEKS